MNTLARTARRLVGLAVVLAVTAGAAQGQAIQAVTEANGFSRIENGKVVGPATQVVEATLKEARFDDYRVNLFPWARAYDMARQQPNVLIYLIARTPEREPQFKWVGEIARVQYHFYKLRRNADIVVRDLDDAKRYRVGVTRNDVREEYLRQQGFVRLVVSAQNAENFRKLVDGQVQLIPLPDEDAEALAREQGVDVRSLEKVYTLTSLTMDLYMAYSAATADDVVDRTRKAFAHVKADGELERALGSRR